MTENRRDILIFPLHTVLFPGGVLPLKVFEQRYIELTKTCVRDDTPFGVCLIQAGAEVGAPAVPETVGCLATITQWDMPQLGLFHLVTRGADRFRIRSARVAPNGLMSAEVDMLATANPGAPVDPACRKVLELLIEKAGAEHFPSPIELDDATWVAYRLAEVLPVELATKQRLLELDDPAARFACLRQLLAEQGIAG